MLKSLLAAAAIETPLFVWFLSIKNPHDEKFIILATYHLAGCLIGQLTALALARVISERAADVIVWAVIFVVQFCLVAFVAFAIMQGREKLRS